MPRSITSSSARSDQAGDNMRYIKPTRNPPSVRPAPRRSTGSSSKRNIADKISTGPAPTIALVQKHTDAQEERDPGAVLPISEHKEKYVEWDVHNRVAAVKPPRGYTPVVPFHVGMDVSQWQSETKKQFHEHAAADQQSGRPVAGVRAMNSAKNPNSFAWQLDNKAALDNFSDDEPMSHKGGVVHSGGHAHHEQISEQAHQYNWPKMEERVRPAHAPHSTLTNPVVTDGYQYNDRVWQSEYDDRCAELRMKQQQVLGNPVAPSAGVSRPASEKSPAYYAWKKQQQKQADGGAANVPERIPYDIGASEYEARYQRWPLGQQAENEAAAAATAERVASQPKLNLFNNHAGGVDAFIGDRTQSLYSADYHKFPAADSDAASEPTAPVAGKQTASREEKPAQRSKKAAPVAAAAAAPTPLFHEDDPHAEEHKRDHPGRRSLVNARSEYIAKYNWPEQAGRTASCAGSEEFSNVDHGGVLPHDGNTEDWGSEYDVQCAALRDRQRAMLDAAGAASPSRVAGKPSAPRPHSEFYFANEDLPPPPPVNVAPSSPMDRARKSEYNAKYVELPLDQRSENFKEKVEAEMNKGNLNLFSGPRGEGVESEYGSMYTPKNACDAAAPPAGPTVQKAPSAPSQFAWGLNDPNGAKVYDPTPTEELMYRRAHTSATPDTTGRIPTETGERFKWPLRCANDDGNIAGKHSSLTEGDGDAFALTDGSVGVTEKWPYNDDDSCGKKQQGSPNSVAAGIVAVDKTQIPNFYAWADEEQKKPPARVAGQFPVEGVELSPRHTEYDDKYVKFDASTGESRAQEAAKAKATRDKTKEDHLNAVFAPLEGEENVARSEYADSYNSKKEQKQQQKPEDSKQAKPSVVNPPQFAWTLIDGVPKAEEQQHESSKKTRKSIARDGKSEKDLTRTETGARFQWPVASLADEIADIAEAARLAAIRNHSTKLFARDDDSVSNDGSDHWKSMYAAQSQPHTNQAADTHQVPPSAGSNPADGPKPPAFFAWEPKDPAAQLDEALIVVQRTGVPHIGVGHSTEYCDNYQPQHNEGTFDALSSNAALLKNRQDAHLLGTMDRFDATTTGKDRKFRGVSEYDSKYTAAGGGGAASMHTSSRPESFAAKYDYAHSLKHTNMEAAVLYKKKSCSMKQSDFGATTDTCISLDSLNDDVQVPAAEIPSRPKTAPAIAAASAARINAKASAGAENFLTEYTASFTKHQLGAASNGQNLVQTSNPRFLNSSVVLGSHVPRTHAAHSKTKALLTSSTSFASHMSSARSTSSSAAPSSAASTCSSSTYNSDDESEASSQKWAKRRQGLQSHKNTKSCVELKKAVLDRTRQLAELRSAAPLPSAAAAADATSTTGSAAAATATQMDDSVYDSLDVIPASNTTANTLSDQSSICSTRSTVPSVSIATSGRVYFNGSAIATAGSRTDRANSEVASVSSMGMGLGASATASNIGHGHHHHQTSTIPAASSGPAPAGRATSPFAKRQYHISAGTMNSFRSSIGASSSPARSRSAPPCKSRSTLNLAGDGLKKKTYVDETTANPVLLHRRYPYNSDKHNGRWSTETGSSYKWQKATNVAVAGAKA